MAKENGGRVHGRRCSLELSEVEASATNLPPLTLPPRIGRTRSLHYADCIACPEPILTPIASPARKPRVFGDRRERFPTTEALAQGKTARSATIPCKAARSRVSCDRPSIGRLPRPEYRG